ncbi:MAG: aspartate-semialdehyde dehydrogenase [Candidatus Omnitrophica bacterium CG08_land_8_20_14_0_20_41_16]|uniref:Aspartate-semialdehyde dehydrogenase n=1 Tax=Candidatus Sherwoodlollariibacterium unditelluris TaxID=1974757 RepID=A0A2G9YJB1_9BACT|nr:MAG: aspartate-semialdehyde dehydrogenase [Candidatus Omnitrophica bacterium CG23_combo_of_CG06-09_8_20_14_all_41_10]PIS33681.1 MAG: aspartate-semialdehyde dehydrogenase [Candidatus Omnitrophica bacterium CG08_land_8_20_14_0_20_41_16]
MKKYNVAVIGVGAVGIEMLRVLKQRNFPVNELRVFARSARDIEVDGEIYSVKPITPDGFGGIDIALFAGTEGEKGAAVTYAAEAVKKGAVVIDNGADFRMDLQVPLVVPEVNAADVKSHKGIIANPNCSTIQMVVALNPIHKKAGIKRIIVTTLQAASGAGKGAVEQLKEETSLIAQGGFNNVHVGAVNKSMPQQLAYNVFPHIGSFAEGDYTNEEWKLVKETHKIMHAPKLKISATTVRVPVRTGHSESVYIETDKYISVNKVREIFSKSPGVILMDDPNHNIYPMPKDVEGRDEVFVGRIRQDAFVKNGLWLWVVADNLRKGAATNAVQIAEELIK